MNNYPDIKQLIPQQPPFVMVGKVVDATIMSCTTCLTIEADNVLVEDGRLSAAGLLENVAQSCATWQSIKQLQTEERPRVGVIGSIRNCSILQLPQVGETITTYITTVADTGNMQVIHAQTKLNDQIIVETDMTIALN
ncbi:MAG: pseudouridylate synthase [Paludibacteraceae bacterium]|nr:pseudouridylate synthase [Paludibacteraceae bacterium]